MHKRLNDAHQELLLAQALIYFVFIGIATIAIAVAAHLQ
jgi:hypothetical protein